MPAFCAAVIICSRAQFSRRLLVGYQIALANTVVSTITSVGADLANLWAVSCRTGDQHWPSKTSLLEVGQNLPLEFLESCQRTQHHYEFARLACGDVVSRIVELLKDTIPDSVGAAFEHNERDCTARITCAHSRRGLRLSRATVLPSKRLPAFEGAAESASKVAAELHRRKLAPLIAVSSGAGPEQNHGRTLVESGVPRVDSVWISAPINVERTFVQGHVDRYARQDRGRTEIVL